MCLIVIGWQVHADYPLVVAANRDEFHARPTAFASRWADFPHIIGGRDLEAGGTWLGLSDWKRFAAVTNVREPGMAKGLRSRGELTANFLASNASAMAYANQLPMADYSGFNLLLCDGDSLVYASNRDGEPRALPPGVYGLSNHVLDTPWPKLVRARERFSAALTALPEETAFFALLEDREIMPDAVLPATGVSLEWERLLSAIFVQSDGYGTRASTVVRMAASGAASLTEHSFAPDGQVIQSATISTGV